MRCYVCYCYVFLAIWNQFSDTRSVNAELGAIKTCPGKQFDLRLGGLKKDTKSRIDVNIVPWDIRNYFQNHVR